ncbi:MAG: type II toxin-antitoxin system MqsA family antitoxin [Firmicutes bacterium]|nr:type II toxin-antitoxin system MqsA family antitoxin [Bacillota bacterium]
MKCRVCGSKMNKAKTDLPFKIRSKSIVIIKELPVLQCSRCSEYLIDDQNMAKVEQILSSVDRVAELEIVHFAA